MFAGMLPSEPMIAAVRAARAAGIRTGLVSNSWSTSHYDRGLLAELFDARRDLGRGRPAQAAARDLPARRRAARASSPASCVFVDDLRENCAGAEAVGMTAILHRDPGGDVARLEQLLGFSWPAQARSAA